MAALRDQHVFQCTASIDVDRGRKEEKGRMKRARKEESSLSCSESNARNSNGH